MTQTPPPANAEAPTTGKEAASKGPAVSGKTIGAAVGIGSAAIVAALLFVNRKK